MTDALCMHGNLIWSRSNAHVNDYMWSLGCMWIRSLRMWNQIGFIQMKISVNAGRMLCVCSLVARGSVFIRLQILARRHQLWFLIEFFPCGVMCDRVRHDLMDWCLSWDACHTQLFICRQTFLLINNTLLIRSQPDASSSWINHSVWWNKASSSRSAVNIVVDLLFNTCVSIWPQMHVYTKCLMRNRTNVNNAKSFILELLWNILEIRTYFFLVQL